MRVLKLKTATVSQIVKRNHFHLTQKIVSDIKTKPNFKPSLVSVHDPVFDIAWENLKV